MTALTERLRKNADWLGCNYDDTCDDMRQSADRIEKLEAALREISEITERQQLPITAQVHDIARTTLSP